MTIIKRKSIIEKKKDKKGQNKNEKLLKLPSSKLSTP